MASIRVAILALLLTCPAAASAVVADEPPVIRKPMPAPNAKPNVPPLPPAVIDNSLNVEGDDIKAKKVSTRLNVNVLVNGAGPYRFVVDSGADTSVVGLKIAHDLQLPLGTPAILNATTSRNLVDRVKVAQLTIGTGTARNLELPALKEFDIGADGLIGIDALASQRLLMDFEGKYIKVEDARTKWRAEPGEIVVTARRERGQLILTEVRASGYSLDAIIDTGSEVTIGNTALRDKLLRKNRDKFWTVMATGVTGEKVPLQMARIEELRIGPVSLFDVPIAFADVPPFAMFGLSDGPALMIGTDLLESFRRVSLDFRSRKVRFQLRRCSMDAVVVSTSPTNALTRMRSDGDSSVCAR